MKLRTILMFLGCLVGGLGGTLYWYNAANSNFFNSILYGMFIGIVVADILAQGDTKKEA